MSCLDAWACLAVVEWLQWCVLSSFTLSFSTVFTEVSPIKTQDSQVQSFRRRLPPPHSSTHIHLSLNLRGCWATTDDFTTSFLHFPLFSTARWGHGELQTCSFPDVVFPPLFLSVLSSSLYHCALQDNFGQTWWTGDMSIPLQFASLYNGQEVCVSSNCLLDLGTDILVDNMVFVGDAQYLALEPHFHGLFSSLQLCCEGPWFTSIQEDGYNMGAHQSYLGTERNAPVVPNWFQPCQCCCHLCCPGEYLRLGTLVRYNWAQVLEACDPEILSFWFSCWCCWCCHQLGLLSSDLNTVGCASFVEMVNSFCQFFPPTKPLMPSAKWRLVIVLSPMLTVLSWSSKASVMILSRNMLKRMGESRHPYLTPTVVRNQSPMLWADPLDLYGKG